MIRAESRVSRIVLQNTHDSGFFMKQIQGRNKEACKRADSEESRLKREGKETPKAFRKEIAT